MFVSAALNLLVLLPASKKVMKLRQGQCSYSTRSPVSSGKSANCGTAKRDGKQYYEEGPHSDEMRALSKRFGVLHGISLLLNVGVLVGAVAYGFTLGARL